MPYSMQTLPPAVINKSLKVKQAFLSSYESALSRGLSEDDATFSGLQSASAIEKATNALNPKLERVKPQVPSHLAAVLNARSNADIQPPSGTIVQAKVIISKNELIPDESRSLIGATWDKQGRLQLKFDDGARITTEPVPVSESIENHVAISNVQTLDNVDKLQFNLDSAIPSEVGQLTWNDTDGTLDLGLKGGNVTLQVGQEQVTHVYNNTANDFSDLQVLRITGSQGQRLTGALAWANAESTSSTTFAVVTEPILKNQVGFATTSGLVRQVDTSAFPEGAALYLSPTAAGAITSVKPTAPQHTVMLGWCVRSHAVNGSIYVHVQNGFELEELHNVLISNVQNGHVLKYESATGLWKNASPAAASGVTTASYFQKINLVANVPLTIQHNLGIIDKDAFTINTILNSQKVNLNINSVDINSIQITSGVSANQISVSIVGIIA